MSEVCRYSQSNLQRLFADYYDGSFGGLKGKLHKVFFHDHSKELCAKTIVVEDPYTDVDYLDDFAHYDLR